MCLLGVGERRWGRHVDKATDFHRNLVFTNDAVYDFHFRMGTSTQVAVDEYMARKHPPVTTTCQECLADLSKRCTEANQMLMGALGGDGVAAGLPSDCVGCLDCSEDGLNKNVNGGTTDACPQCSQAQCSLDKCSVFV